MAANNMEASSAAPASTIPDNTLTDNQITNHVTYNDTHTTIHATSTLEISNPTIPKSAHVNRRVWFNQGEPWMTKETWELDEELIERVNEDPKTRWYPGWRKKNIIITIAAFFGFVVVCFFTFVIAGQVYYYVQAKQAAKAKAKVARGLVEASSLWMLHPYMPGPYYPGGLAKRAITYLLDDAYTYPLQWVMGPAKTANDTAINFVANVTQTSIKESQHPLLEPRGSRLFNSILNTTNLLTGQGTPGSPNSQMSVWIGLISLGVVLVGIFSCCMARCRKKNRDARMAKNFPYAYGV